MANREFSPFHPHVPAVQLRQLVYVLADVADRLGQSPSWERIVTVATALGISAAALDTGSDTHDSRNLIVDWFSERVHAVDAVRSARYELAQAERALAEYDLTENEPF
jgi:hypothetical protein